MDPLTAVSLAANIIQFVDFTSKLVFSARSIWQSTTGSRAEDDELDLVAQSITRLHENVVILERIPLASAKLTRREKSLLPLQQACVSLGNDLISTLDKLRVSEPRKKWKSVRVALVSVWKEEKVKQMEARLMKLQRQIDSHLISDIQKQQTEVLNTLQEHTRLSRTGLQTTRDLVSLVESIRTNSQHLEASPIYIRQRIPFSGSKKQYKSPPDTEIMINEANLSYRAVEDFVRSGRNVDIADADHFKNEIERVQAFVTQKTSDESVDPIRSSRVRDNQIRSRLLGLEEFYAKRFASHLDELNTYKKRLRLIDFAESNEKADIVALQQSFLMHLDFDMRMTRRQTIKEAHAKTFHWVFEERDGEGNPLSFLNWLENEDKIYWITGKPGCGKSTLMKYLGERKETKEALEKWSQGRRLITAEFYFWNSGTVLQQSVDGLLRSILTQVLDQCPELIPKAFPTRWERLSISELSRQQPPWTRQELMDSLRTLTQEASLSSRFCFFIDGLDEYEGSDGEMVNIIESFNASTCIKFCLSSRPHAEFTKAYGHDACRTLSVHKLTARDIHAYVFDKLDENSTFQAIKSKYPARCKSIVDGVVEHANGVFLWVYLVVSRLLEGIEVNQDRIGDLEKKLQSVPKELDKLFRHILDSVDRDYHEVQAHMFRVACAAEEPLDLMAYYFMDLEDTEHALIMPYEPMDKASIVRNQEIMSIRVNVRCKGLLEVIDIDHVSILFRKRKVQLIHRTFRDFIKENDMQDLIKQRSAPDYDPYRSICLATLAELKTYQVTTVKSDTEACRYGFIDTLLHYALSSELMQDISPSDILGELAALLDKFPKFYLLEGVESPIQNSDRGIYRDLTGDMGDVVFVDLATCRGLVQFPRSRLQTSHPSRSAKEALLEAIVRQDQIFPDPSRYERILNPESVKMLFDLGARPNSCWQLFCDSSYVALRDQSKRESTSEAIFLTMKLFIEYGVDVSLVKEYKYTDVTNRFPAKDAEEIEWLIQANASKRKKLFSWLPFSWGKSTG